MDCKLWKVLMLVSDLKNTEMAQITLKGKNYFFGKDK